MLICISFPELFFFLTEQVYKKKKAAKAEKKKKTSFSGSHILLQPGMFLSLAGRKHALQPFNLLRRTGDCLTAQSTLSVLSTVRAKVGCLLPPFFPSQFEFILALPKYSSR